MRAHIFWVGCALLLVGTLAACTTDSTSLPKPDDLFLGRNPNEPVIKEVNHTGHCASTVIKFEEAGDRANLTYYGQPGDRVAYTFQYADGTETERGAENNDAMTKITQLSAEEIRDLTRITASATGQVGIASSCVIEIAGSD